jgi:hypothetical protein
MSIDLVTQASEERPRSNMKSTDSGLPFMGQAQLPAPKLASMAPPSSTLEPQPHRSPNPDPRLKMPSNDIDIDFPSPGETLWEDIWINHPQMIHELQSDYGSSFNNVIHGNAI